MVKKTRIWKKININGDVWKIRIYPDLYNEDGERVLGLCCYDIREIWMREDSSPSDLFHELGHAVLDSSGNALLSSLGVPEERYYEADELIVSVVSQAYFDCLERNKWLKLPKKYPKKRKP